MSKEYEVGFKKPPKQTQFKPGQSGNPAGRPKGTKNFKTDLEEELQTKIVIREGGKTLQVSKQRALLMSLIANAIKGDVRAANTLTGLVLKVLDQEEELPGDRRLAPEDEDIHKAFEERVRRKILGDGDEQ